MVCQIDKRNQQKGSKIMLWASKIDSCRNSLDAINKVQSTNSNSQNIPDPPGVTVWYINILSCT
jgi:hypothetical protein